jgi:L-alanine-DL-glutamate epimerase-like enolase superfamily enzyme
MFNIAQAEVKLWRIRHDGTSRNSRSVWREKVVAIAVLRDEQGRLGLGEAWCEGGTAGALTAFFESAIRPLVVGRSPYEREALRHAIFNIAVTSGCFGLCAAAASAVDIACWDLIGHQCGRPIWQLAGGYGNRVPVYASGGLYGESRGPNEIAAEVESYLGSGFNGVKIKFAGCPREMDLARVDAVRRVIGPRRDLMLDCGFRMSRVEAIDAMKVLQKFDLAFLEAPISPFDVDGWAALSRLRLMPLAGLELQPGIHLVKDLLDRQAVSFVQFDPTLVGGVTESLAFAALARAANTPITLHQSSSSIALMASAHFGAAIANCHSVEFHMIHRSLSDCVAAGTFVIENGILTLDQSPGLGLDNAKILARIDGGTT